MKKQIELLFYNYYKFQILVGNRDVAPFFAVSLITFISMTYYASIMLISTIIFPQKSLIINDDFIKYSIFLLLIIIFILLYYQFLYKKKYKNKIIELEVSKEKKNKIFVIFFPIVGFLLFNLGWILKMLQNQGKL